MLSLKYVRLNVLFSMKTEHDTWTQVMVSVSVAF